MLYHKFKLSPTSYQTVIDGVLMCKGIPGFGVHTVRAVAHGEYQRIHNDTEVGDWNPSDNWCLWFLHKVMHFSIRRVTGKTRSHVLDPKQEDLFSRLLDTLAIDLTEGVPPELIIGSDEFGMNYFPQSDYTWEKVGAKQVLLDINDDKRQWTGNIVHNACGTIPTFQSVYGGKTSACIPKTASNERCKDWIFGVSENHWSNLQVYSLNINH
jgi:hypothetical protein